VQFRLFLVVTTEVRVHSEKTASLHHEDIYDTPGWRECLVVGRAGSFVSGLWPT